MYLPQPTLERIVEAIQSLGMRDNDVAMILIGEKDGLDITKMISTLNEQGIDFFGALFPRVIYDEQAYEDGAVIDILPALAKPFMIKGLNHEKIELPRLIDKIKTEKKLTSIILVDGLTYNISGLLEEMFNQFGNSIHYLGGGAGSLSLKQAACVFNAEGYFQDAAAVAFIDLESRLGVRHGWQKIMGPFVATKTHKNVIMELNWRNAVDVYREVVEPDAGVQLTRENFFDVAKAYPFGIFKAQAEDIVRDPIAFNEKGELICVADVPENAVLNILKGYNSLLIEAAGEAVPYDEALAKKKNQHHIVIDCVSRAIFLGEEFPTELATIKKKMKRDKEPARPIGALTLGEISSYGEGYLEYLNKTVVVGVLYD
jgi:hypothetical protein